MKKEHNLMEMPYWLALIDKPIVLLDTNLSVCFLNKAWKLLLNQPVESYVNRPFSELISIPSLASELNMLEQDSVSFNLSSPNLFENEVFKMTFWLDYQIDGSQLICGVVHIDAEQAQLPALETSIEPVGYDMEMPSPQSNANKNYFHAVIDAMQEGIVRQSVTGEIVHCNQAALDILGLTYAQISGRDSFDPNWKSIKEDGSDFPGEEHPSMVTLKTGKPQSNILMGVHRPTTSSLAWISINSQPIIENDELTGVVTTFADITHLKSYKRKAIKHERQFQKLFEAINYSVIIINNEGKIVLANPAVNALFNYTQDEIIWKSVDTLLQEDERADCLNTFFDFFHNQLQQEVGLRLDREVHAQKKNGDIFPIKATLSHLNYGREHYVLCIIQDLTHDLQRKKLEKAHTKITDSLRYAQRIQLALLDNHNHLLDDFRSAVIFLSPKDIVSGDFYWYERIQQLDFDEKTSQYVTRSYKILVVADCTGHGVPGAFMAALGNAFLHEIINEHHIIEPQQIIQALDAKMQMTLRRKVGAQIPDGMDIGVLLIDEETQKAYFSGAKHPLYLIRENSIHSIKGSAFSVGGKHQANKKKKFSQTVIQLQDYDRLYMSSDGFQDQFGGQDGRKYLRRAFKEFLLELSILPMEVQKERIAEELVSWKKDELQTDDILIVGVEI